jgi:oligopeptide transport system substrate-binding protein
MMIRSVNFAAMALGLGLFLFCGCGPRETMVEIADRAGQYRVGNGGEPGDLDPQIAIGQLEHDIMLSLYEGLVYGDAKDVSPRPGVAESWNISPDELVYTFHLRKNARWSNGEPVTARDFCETYHRLLMPSLAEQYSYMLYPVTNAEAFNTGQITNFDQVGFKVVDDYTLRLTLHSPTPYLLSMMVHDSWYPLPIATIKKYGAIDDRSNPWTRPEHFVGNGPFVLKEWRMNSHVLVVKSPTYWDAEHVRLNSIYFDPEDNYDTEERMFRSGQLHTIRQPPLSKVAFYSKNKPDLIKIYPLLANEFFKLNVTRPPLNDRRVRQALALAIDRHAITEFVERNGAIPAFCLTPPGTAGFTAAARLREDPAQARRLLAEAGYADGANFPKLTLLYNTAQTRKALAETVQEMWRKNLNIHVTLQNQEWKVYLDAMQHTNYDIGLSGWIADYIDPSTFLDLFLTDGGNNETGWSNADYDRLCRLAASTGDTAARYGAYQKAEAILMEEMPVVPIFIFSEPRLIQPNVKGWYPNLLDSPNYRSIYLVPQTH